MVQKASVIRVEGRVQRVGYRRLVLEAAQELGISGYVKNEKDGSVSIFAQGAEQEMTKFIEMIRSPPPPILIRNFLERPARPRPEVKIFQIKFGTIQEELQEGFGAMEREFKDYRREFGDFVEEFRDYREEFRDFVKKTDENFRLVLEKYGEISEKLTEAVKSIKEDLLSTRQELIRAVDNLSKLIEEFIKTRKEELR